MKFVCVTLLLFASPLWAFERAKPPEPGPSPAISFPEYREETLSNGLKIFIIEDERAPTIVLRLVVKSGSINDADKPGTADLAAELLSHGSKSRTALQFAEEIDFIGATFESGASADATYASISGLTKFSPQMLDLFSDAVLNATFPEDELAKIKKKQLAKLALERKEPNTLAEKLRGKLIFGTHPYGAFPTEESIEAIERSDLQQFQAQHFLANNASLAVVGDVKRDKILPQLEQAFGNWAAGEMPKLNLPELPKAKEITIHLVDRPGSVQSNVLVAQLGVPRDNPKVPELTVLNSILGGGFSGRLFQNLREQHGWTYGAYSNWAFNKLAGIFSAGTEVRNEVTHLAIIELLKELRRIREEAVPETELSLQRQYVVGNYLLSLESALRTATRVQEIDLYQLSPNYYKNYARRVGGVTADEIRQLAHRYVGVDDLVIIVVGEAKEVREQLEKIGKVIVYDTDLKKISAEKEM